MKSDFRSFSSSSATKLLKVSTISNAALIRKYDLTERRPVQSDHDYCDSPNMANLIEYKKAVISYIADYVAKMVVKQTLCTQCCTGLGSTKSTTMSSSLKMKDRVLLQSVKKLREDFSECLLPLVVNFLKVCTEFVDDPLYKIL